MCSAPQYRTAMGSVEFSKMKMKCKTNHDYLVDVDNVRETESGHIIKQLFID